MKHTSFFVRRWTSLREQLPLLSRVLAATVGCYVLAALFSATTLALPIAPSEAVLWGAQLSFLVWGIAVLGVFLARTATRAWVFLVLSSLLCLSAILWHYLNGNTI